MNEYKNTKEKCDTYRDRAENKGWNTAMDLENITDENCDKDEDMAGDKNWNKNMIGYTSTEKKCDTN